MRERIVTALALFSISMPAYPFWAKLDLDADFGIARDSNLANGMRASDRIAETSANAALAASMTQAFARSAITYGIRVEATRFEGYGDLNNHAFTGYAQAAYQPVPGYREPWFEARWQAGAFRHRNSDARDGTQWNAGLSIAKRFTDRIKATLAFEDERRTSHVAGFDTNQHRWKVGLEYKITERSVWSVNAAQGKGDYVFTQTSPCTVPSPCMVDNALQSAGGPVFFAFKAHGTRRDLGFGYRFRVNATVSIDAALNHTALQLGGDVEARRLVAFIGVSKRF